MLPLKEYLKLNNLNFFKELGASDRINAIKMIFTNNAVKNLMIKKSLNFLNCKYNQLRSNRHSGLHSIIST